MDIELEIEGVPERTVAEAIRKAVQRVRHMVTRSGNWRITIGPSETRGEWDLGILAPPNGWHLVSFSAPVERLPEVVEHTLRERLELPASAVIVKI